MIYKCEIDSLTQEQYHKWYSLMTEEKQKRVNRFVCMNDRKRTVAGEMLAKKAIAEWCNVKAENVVLDETIHGKPFARDLKVEFNISHSNDIVLCGIDDVPIGIDVEKIRTIDFDTITYVCNEKDLYYIFGSKNEKNSSTTLNNKNICNFFEIWTAKEAICKFEGYGLYKDLKSISIGQYLLHTEYIENGEYIVTICSGKTNKNCN